jgi:hypothetical protein
MMKSASSRGSPGQRSTADPATARWARASKADRDAAFSTGMTDGMEVSYKRLDDVLAEG